MKNNLEDEEGVPARPNQSPLDNGGGGAEKHLSRGGWGGGGGGGGWGVGGIVVFRDGCPLY